ncbi:MAG: Fe-S cluster assembly protein SufD [Candidatus Puniceispirillaceae bacterium]|jgi:Fe-S cluster assembly protein SufD
MPASTMQPNLDQLAGLTGVRAGALLRWQATGWPDRRAEQWRFTRLSSVEKMDLRPAEMAAKQPAAVAASLPDNAVILSFSNGVLDMAGLAALPGGVTASLLSDNDAALAALAELVPAAHPISNLSLAAMTTGLHLDIAGTVEVPIILVFTGDDNGVSAHPVISVRLADGASAVMAEWHQSSVGLSAPLMGIIVGDKARLDYAKVQQESSASAHLAATGLRLGEGSVFEGFQISAGGQLARLETHIVLSGENADCTLSAIYLGRDKQHHDITTNMNHAKGHCLSNQIIRGVLDDSARGVFQGKVHVAPDAQKTDGQQMSRALLLSRKAEADAKPELEIYADDVLCAHGATVGELDDTQLFYLTSRGIDRKTARSMLIAAFLDDAIDSITHPALADMLRPVTTAWMNATPNAGDL